MALMMDNCGLHGMDLNGPHKEVTILILPPNCTAIHQPMDPMNLLVIYVWILFYGLLFHSKIVNDLKTSGKLRAGSNTFLSVMRRLAGGHDFHMLVVTRMCF